MMNKKALSVLLSKLAAVVADLTDDEWQAVEQGRFDLRIEPKARRDTPLSDPAPAANIDSLMESLNFATTREEADLVLSAEGIRKDDLLAIAKRLDVSVNRKEANEMIRQKIIENTVGFRIRSRSVQGMSPGQNQ